MEITLDGMVWPKTKGLDVKKRAARGCIQPNNDGVVM
uniref:Uncharacterized protein n=1 Tax=Vitis vinifera TaxID=29760 RepID=F6HXG5_VITVI